MATVWMFVAGCVAIALVGFLCFVWGVGIQSRQSTNDHLKKLGATREDLKIYHDTLKFISDLTQHAAMNDALAPIGEQTLLSDTNKKRAGDLLARYRKEHTG